MSYARDNEGVTGASSCVRNPRLLDEVRRRLRPKHYSLRTEQAYSGWIRRFILANGKRHPRQLGGAEVETFLSALASEREVAAGTQERKGQTTFPYRRARGRMFSAPVLSTHFVQRPRHAGA
jgi:integrase-like protein